MILRVEINNFQSHKDTVLDLHPGINVVVGNSDTGKTVIIRALVWLIWNRPIGDAFRSKWGGTTGVAAELTGGQEVMRIRDARDNMYLLDDHEFHAIKTDVPVEIINALNIGDINLQRQFDRPFLLDSSPGAVAQFFNATAHIDVIDRAVGNVQRWMRALEHDIRTSKQSLAELEEQLKEYNDLDRLDGEVAELERADTGRARLTDERLRISQVLTEINRTDIDYAACDSVLRLDKMVTGVCNAVFERNELSAELSCLKDALLEIEHLQTAVNRATTVVELETFMADVTDATYKLGAMSNEQLRLTVVLNNIEDVDANLCDAEYGINELQRKFDQSFPAVCPLCGKAA